jgi:L-alanine-DL-glutamate epimerase-like enolase superfamily enzyme
LGGQDELVVALEHGDGSLADRRKIAQVVGKPSVFGRKCGRKKGIMTSLAAELQRAGKRLTLDVTVERWKIRGRFTISRGSKREAAVVVATLSDGDQVGRGECVPYARYGESVEGVMSAIRSAAPAIAPGMSRAELSLLLRPGAARNALDCALWDLEAKRAGRSAAALAGISAMRGVLTAYTLSLDTPEAMAKKAREAARAYPLLKLKLGGDGDAERLSAVRSAAPRARLIVDANEAWRPDQVEKLLACCASVGVELVEQPLPAGMDDILARVKRPVPVCADESVHDYSSVERLAGRYDAVNIKLDKTGGLTEAVLTARRARKLGLKIMAGSMVATSLAIAPALLLAQTADYVDLDGPLLLARDRVPGLIYASGMVLPPQPALWG